MNQPGESEQKKQKQLTSSDWVYSQRFVMVKMELKGQNM